MHEGGSTSRRLSERWAAENGLNWQIRMELGAIETIKEAVKHGMGIGILPRRSARREELSGELVLRELPGKVSVRRICLAYREEDEPVRQAAAFIDFMRGEAGGIGSSLPGETPKASEGDRSSRNAPRSGRCLQ
ncbi:LysR family transcriptional regulator substrate-binding protein [Cohnella ginsengisoli]|uniref:LysR family transcriptional regulator substrate-binding protein n=1 Tax=Cohnella ginsengisoli TaxID=425004 RepID=A0A9X4KQX7_9BACL|nr:LysR family transcriptional regulator substrate-binding protein [Cohnella ginsengisoli]MDG0794612.1 LysR family transcriptional regulator substrate-binding protein [Cohnella ginsengisoli]